MKLFLEGFIRDHFSEELLLILLSKARSYSFTLYSNLYAKTEHYVQLQSLGIRNIVVEIVST